MGVYVFLLYIQFPGPVNNIPAYVYAFSFKLWTMYCESYAGQHSPGSENYITSHSVIMDFWGRVTPGVLQLLSHSQVVSRGFIALAPDLLIFVISSNHIRGFTSVLHSCNAFILLWSVIF